MTRLCSKIGQFYKFWSFSKINLLLLFSTDPNSLVVIVLLGIYHVYVWYTAGVTILYKYRFWALHVTRHCSKISQFYNFWSFSKIRSILPASTLPNHLIVNGLLGIYPS